jgi:hypothetical protein
MSPANLRVVEDDFADIYDKDPGIVQAEQLNDAAMAIANSNHHGVNPTVISMLRRAVNLAPHYGQVWSNIGLICWRMGQMDEAEQAFAKAVSLSPESHSFQGNMGIYLGAVGRYDEAIFHLEEAMRLDPTNLGPRWDRCLLYLRQGDWSQGLWEYDIRREHRGPSLYPQMPAPLWHGEDLNGKTLYVQGEQGVGDRFLFSRYFAWIKDKWPDCRLKVCLHDSMTNIFWEYRSLVDEFLPLGVPWPEDLDYCVYLCTLPAVHGSQPNTVPPDPGLLRKRILRARQGTDPNLPQPHLRPSLKVGITWTGNPTQSRNHDRTIPLEMLLPLAEDPRIALYSFQGSPGQQDIPRLMTDHLICDLGPEIEAQGWVGTGLALMEMDLVISVCTSVAHLAGALGVPCWTLLCSDPYWVWSRSGDSTPWYPGMKLYRQKDLGNWRPVIKQVADDLRRFADERLESEERQ